MGRPVGRLEPVGARHLDAQRHWLTVERLSVYAPELSPVEYLWVNLKVASWPTAPATGSPRPPTKPRTASSESATAIYASTTGWTCSTVTRLTSRIRW
jgi:transposase